MLISVLMAVKNESLHITEALNSVLEFQDDEFDLEIIIVDDSSTDDTFKIVERVQDSRIKLFRNTGKGKVEAFNFAFENSSGDFVVLFAGDDVFISSVLVARVKPLLDDNVKFTACKIEMKSNDKKFDSVVIPKASGVGAITGASLAFSSATANKLFPIPSVLPNEDTWIKCFIDFNDFSVFHISDIGIFYRIHENNSHKRSVKHVHYKEQIRRRHFALILFSAHFDDKLSEKQRAKLNTAISTSLDVYSGNLLSIFLRKGLTLKERLSAIFYCNRFLFFLRSYFYGFFSGR